MVELYPGDCLSKFDFGDVWDWPLTPKTSNTIFLGVFAYSPPKLCTCWQRFSIQPDVSWLASQNI